MSAGSAPRRPETEPLLAAELAALRREMEARRLGIFRQYIGQRVCLASPLLLDACWPKELDDAAWRLRPSRSWPKVQQAHVTVRGWSAQSAAFGQRRSASGSVEGDAGTVVADMLALRVSSRSAHMILRVGETVIRTADDGGRLYLPGIMAADRKEAITHACLDRAFRHPVVDGREYRIYAILPDIARMRTIVEFSAAPSEWRLPWARPLWHAPDVADEVPF